MQKFILFLLFSSNLLAQSTNYPKTIIISAVITIDSTTNYPLIQIVTSGDITNIDVQIDNPEIRKLEISIKNDEQKFKDNYDNLPTIYASKSSLISSNTLNRIIILWNEREKAELQLENKKNRLEKLKRGKNESF